MPGFATILKMAGSGRRSRAVEHPLLCVGFVALVIAGGGCASHKPEPIQRLDITPVAGHSMDQSLRLDPSVVKPMYTELLPIDLASVVQVAVAQNLDIKRARQSVEASQGRYESTVGAVFPAIVPTALFEHVEGTVRATEGNLVGVGFNTFQPSIAVQWVVNPARVYYDLIAAKKRLGASTSDEKAAVLESLRNAVVQFYDLILTQAKVAAADQGVAEARELLRITQLRTSTGVGVPADERRAEARLAQRQQELITSMRDFYDSSVRLSLSLHLDATVTLIPSLKELPPTHLVRDDLAIGELLKIAVTFRPDLHRVRALREAIAADEGSTWWGGFGPQFQASYQYGGITGHANNVVPAEGVPGNLIVNPTSSTGSFSPNPVVNGLVREGIFRGAKRADSRDDQSYGFSDQQKASAGVGWRLSLATFGDSKTAKAITEQARIEAIRHLDRVRADVIMAAQASRANRELIGLAKRQVTAADEALRLVKANLKAGTLTTLDVLQAQDAATKARLQHAKAVVRYNQSQVNLLASLGLADEKTMNPANVDDSTDESDDEPSEVILEESASSD